MKKQHYLIALIASGTLVSCTQQQQQWAGIGAAAGAGQRILRGGDSGDIVRDAALGAGVGAGAAAVKENQERKAGYYNTGGDTPAAPPAPATTRYPVATPTNDPNVVISPYKPYNRVGVKNLRPGQKAQDPYTKQIFLVPGQ